MITKAKEIISRIKCFNAIITLFFISCEGNSIKLERDTLTILSENASISHLSIEVYDHSSSSVYEICYVGHNIIPNFIKLDSIPFNYTIDQYLNGYKKNGTFRPKLSNNNTTYSLIWPNCNYIVTNVSIGDAAAQSLSFNTDSLCKISTKSNE